MKKFGFKKSDKKSDVQDNPYAQQPSDNPYAQQPANDPYANAPPPPRQSPYQQGRGIPSGPRPGGGLPSGPRAGGGPGGGPGGYNTPPPPYGGPDTGFSNEKFGASGGYGGNRYENNNPPYGANRSTPSVRQGGYGGLGDNDAQRNDLFGGAQARQQQQQQQKPSFGGDDRYGGSGASGVGGGSSYGGYGDQRELTEEEQEEQEVQNVKDEIKRTNREAEQSLDRSLAIGYNALEVATGSLARLGAQGDRLDNTARNLNVASVHARNAEAKSKELKTLNRSMFAVHVGNPFNAKSRAAAEEAAMSAQYQADKDKQARLKEDGYANNLRLQNTMEKLHNSTAASARNRSGNASKYTFEATESDEEQEDRFDDKLDQLGNVVGKLNLASRAIGDVVVQQNATIDKIRDQADSLDTHVQKNNAYLERNFRK